MIFCLQGFFFLLLNFQHPLYNDNGMKKMHCYHKFLTKAFGMFCEKIFYNSLSLPLVLHCLCEMLPYLVNFILHESQKNIFRMLLCVVMAFLLCRGVVDSMLLITLAKCEMKNVLGAVRRISHRFSSS